MKRKVLAILFILIMNLQAGIGEGTSQVGPLPVELSSFSVIKKGNAAVLNWTTATEINNFGFSVESQILNKDWKTLGFVNGHGNSNSPKEYSFVDSNPLRHCK